MKNKVKIRKAVFITMALYYIIAIALGVFVPQAFADAQSTVVYFAADWFGWLYDGSVLLMTIVCVWIMFSKVGNIKLGGEKAKPILSNWNWFAICLCGGIATGLVFWGIAEPVTHYMDPIPGLGYEAGTSEAALTSLATTYFHWGFVPYATYAVAGVGIGIATYNMKLPYRVSSALYPIFGKKSFGWIGTVMDILCLFGLAGGVSASLGEAALQLGAGLGLLNIVDPNKYVWMVIVIAIVITFIISSYTGIGRGVRFLSDCNAKLYIGMLVFILICGPTRYILAMGFEALGIHVDLFARQITYLGAHDGDQWPIWWTINYWSWWIAYMALMGMFLAKIAQGRTLKQFMMCNFVLPSVFGIIWFAVFGVSAINIQQVQGGLWEAMGELGTEASVFLFFEHFPLSKVMSVIFLITAFLSIVTLADSMTTTISSLSIEQDDAASVEPPAKVKIFWGLTIASMGLVNIITASDTGEVSCIDATKQLAIVSAFPLLFAMTLLTIATIKMLVQYHKYNTVDDPENSVVDPECMVDVALLDENS